MDKYTPNNLKSYKVAKISVNIEFTKIESWGNRELEWINDR